MNTKSNQFWRWFFFVYVAVVLAFSALPIPGHIIAGGDKFKHLTAFFAFALFFIKAFPNAGFLKVFLWGLFFGIFIEIMQFFIPGRSSELLDIAADGAGLVLGMAACSIYSLTVARQ